MIRALVKKGVDPTRFPDMTYPVIVAILTDDDADRRESEGSRAKKALRDFKAGKYGGPKSGR